MYVYRIEDEKTGKGCYISARTKEQRKLSDQMCLVHTPTYRPGYFSDGFWSFKRKYSGDDTIRIKFACTSIEGLKFWFENFFERLLQTGFVIRRYWVNKKNVYEGNSKMQVLFLCDNKKGKTIHLEN